MGQTIYKMFLMKYKDAWYALSPEEQQKLGGQGEESLKRVGGERLISRVSVWSDEKWLGWGVESYPDLEAVQAHALTLYNMNWFKYIESESYLGVEMPAM